MLFDHSLAGIFIVQGTRITFANKRAEEIIGYTIEEARGMDFWDFIHPDYRALVRDRAMRRLRGEEVPDRYEYLMITKGGEPRWAEIWATPIDFQGGKAILATIVDINERRRAEEARLEAEKELERHKRQLYQQAILALTHGKLVILEPAEIESALVNPQITVELSDPKDVSMSRHLIHEFATANGLTGDRLDGFMLAIGEATMNAIKHTGAGIVFAGIRQNTIWVGVRDFGSGMDTFVLTQAVLRKGFSTKPSLGLGYTFILNGSDHVLLSTSPHGTTVVMEKNSIEAEPDIPVDLSRIPGLW
jgi:PAS domain S-box-containing protein